jgi:class 3 adenylate cyclase
MDSDSSPETLTFFFADLESSTRLWERFPDAMKAGMEGHDAILRDAVEDSDGRVVKITGDGPHGRLLVRLRRRQGVPRGAADAPGRSVG